MYSRFYKLVTIVSVFCYATSSIQSQDLVKAKYNNSSIYSGIEVGSKGVKMSVIEFGKNAQSTGAINVIKDTSINTDFISFTEASFSATLDGLFALFNKANTDYDIPSNKIFTVISSGVKMQADKDQKSDWLQRLVDAFRLKINDPNRLVEIVDVSKEAQLSHLGIVPESRRYSTFLIDIGSGNTKGGFFPYGNTNDFKLFELNWGTKSTANATEKRCEDDHTLSNFNKHLTRVLSAAENSEIIYAVNSSGAYPLSDNIAVSGGIAWAIATLSHPELIDDPVIPVTFEEVEKFAEKIYKNYNALSASFITSNINKASDKESVKKWVTTVNKVFDQKALMAGTGLLLKIMRQFESVYSSKYFYLIKNGQVGWVSAYVDQSVSGQ